MFKKKKLLVCLVDSWKKENEESTNSPINLNYYRPDCTSGKTFASGSGGMGFKFRADQISHTLPTTHHRCNLDCMGLGAKPRRWLMFFLQDQIFCAKQGMKL